MKKPQRTPEEKQTRIKNFIIALLLIALYTFIIFMCCYVYIKVFHL